MLESSSRQSTPRCTTMTVGNSLLPEYDQEMSNTRKILQCVPDDKLGWKPHEKSMSLDRLASHVAEFPQWVAMTLNTEKLELTAEFKPYLATSSKALVERFDADVIEGRRLIANASDEDMATIW